MTTIQLEEVQGIVFSGYTKYMAKASYYLLRIDNSASTKTWLKFLVDNGLISHGAEKPDNTLTNALSLAISYSGLKKLQLPEKDLQSFELSFQEGMNSEHRSALLGDSDNNDPQHWRWGNANSPVDLLLILFSKDDSIHSATQAQYEDAFHGAGLSVVQCVDGSPQRKTPLGFIQEHFGFADGISDPVVDGFPTVKGAGDIAPGEFLLGYPNQYDGKETKIPISRDFGVNGTYLVVRQLQQHVGALRKFVAEESTRQGLETDYLAAKFVGRWPSGALIEPHQTIDPQKKDSNNFDFSADPRGEGCPMGAHIRRANPRGVGLGESVKDSLTVASRHRILRRGRSYGSFLEDQQLDDGQERGLVFICLNANIERQFEFIQHTWINNIKFAGLYDEDDPLIGGGSTDRSFTIQDAPLRRHVKGFQSFVSTLGGAYFFLPSLKAIRILSNS